MRTTRVRLACAVVLYGLSVSIAAAQEELRCGESRAAVLAAGATDVYAVESTGAAVLVADVVDTSGSTGLLRLLGRSEAAQEESCSGSLTLFTPAGSSTLEVSDCIGAESGPYTLSVNIVSEGLDNCAEPLSCGATREDVSFATPGEVDAYRFVGSEGDPVTIRAYDASGQVGTVRLRLFDPDGEPVEDTCSSLVSAQLEKTGTYTILASACERPRTGSYRVIFESPSCPAGPHVAYFGVATADDRPVTPTGSDGSGRPIFERPLGQGFSLILEARTGASGRPAGLQAFDHDPDDPQRLPDLQMLVSRPLGLGTPLVCDKQAPDIGGIPGTPSLEFSNDQAVSNAVNDLGCRVNDGQGNAEGRRNPLDACTRDPQTSDFRFVDPTTTTQFCAPIARAWAFPPGDTIVRARLRDAEGQYGAAREIVVRVRGSLPFEVAPLGASNLIGLGNLVYFTANDGTTGTELWESDGSAGQTRLVRDLFLGEAGSFPRGLTLFGGRLFYLAQDAPDLWHLWNTIPGFSQTVSNVNTGVAVAQELALTAAGDQLFFFVERGRSGFELWRTEGTEASTARVAALSSSPGVVDSVAVVGDLFFFSFVDVERNAGTYQLWRSDGTEPGTMPIRSFDFSGSTTAVLDELTDVNGALFFIAGGNRSGGFGLWKSNGTAAGTELVKSFALASDNSTPTELTAVGEDLFFAADDGVTGIELWRSDGTESGTRLVRDISPGRSSARPTGVTAFGDGVLFAAEETTTGRELWWSDGAGMETVLVKDLRPGPSSSSPTDFREVGGTAFFTAEDGRSGREVWLTDGSATGTAQALDIGPGPTSSHPAEYTPVGGRVFFRAVDELGRQALWAVAVPGLLPVCTGDCDGNRQVTIDEIITGVRIALDSLSAELCTAMDDDGDGMVRIEELVRSVGFATNGCEA